MMKWNILEFAVSFASMGIVHNCLSGNAPEYSYMLFSKKICKFQGELDWHLNNIRTNIYSPALVTKLDYPYTLTNGIVKG